jgi:hypothetical protein
MPSAPVVMHTVESKINPMLLLSHPPEINKAIKDASGKTKKEEQEAELEAEAARRLAQMVRESREDIDRVRFLLDSVPGGIKACNPAKAVCVAWENPNAPDLSTRGKAVAFRFTESEHYAEVKTTGATSNTLIAISHNDDYASVVIGDSGSITNIVSIKQRVGTVARVASR